MSRRPFPGPLTESLITILLKTTYREEIIGDLIEEARTRVLPRRGRIIARAWLLAEAARSLKDLQAARDLRWSAMAGGLTGDFRFALRTLGNRPLFALLTAATLGVGIGASTAMFSVVDGVLLKSLPYREPGRLVTLWRVHADWQGMPEIGGRWDRGLIRFDEYRVWRDQNTQFEDVAVYKSKVMARTGGERATLLAVGEATASLIPTLGVRMRAGRWFSADEEVSVGSISAPVAVVGYDFWQREFGGGSHALGADIVLDGRTHTIVGVLPEDFRLRFLEGSRSDEMDLWVPVGGGYRPGSEAETSSDWEAVGRLAAGGSIRSAEAETVRLLRGDRDPARYDYRLTPRIRSEARGLVSPLVLLLSATAVLLLIGCGNASLLLLGEVEGREHELATRAALGAGPGRIIRQLVTESAVLGLMGSAAGALTALLGTRALLGLAPPLPRWDQVSIDYRALAVCTVLGVATGLIFGVGPAITSSRRAPAASLSRSRRSGGGRRRLLTQVIVGGQVTLTVVLLVLAGFLVKNLKRMTTIDPGFDPVGIASVKATVPYDYRSAEEVLRFIDDAVHEIERIPGVTSVGVVYPLPFSGDAMSRTMILDPDRSGGGHRIEVMRSFVWPGYRTTMGLPLLEGRDLALQDGRDDPLVAVVSESFARQHWPGGSAVGRRLGNVGGSVSITVVGVVGDVTRESLGAPPEPTFYVPLAQWLWRQFAFVARTQDNAGALVAAMMDAIGSVEPDAPLTEGELLSSLIARSTQASRFGTLLMTIFGLVATVLAAAGVFGVTARQVTQRFREMGIRMALGADVSHLVLRAVASSGTTAALGVGAGLVVAWWATRLVAGFVLEFDPVEPLVYGSVTAILCGVCLLASLVPACRIARVDPAAVLRAE